MRQPAPEVELVVVGDELLTGRIVDTDSAFLGRQLAGLGLVPRRVSRVGDDDRSIRDEVSAACDRAGLVFVVGGLGPTPDDMTVGAVARLTGRRLVRHGPTLARVRALFRRRGTAMPRLAARQALVPKGARLLPNREGMVPGMVLRYEAAILVLLPGVPSELEAIFEQGVRPWLARSYRLTPGFSSTVRTFGLAESAIVERSRMLYRRFSQVRAAYYPSTSGVDVVLRSRARVPLGRCTAALARRLWPAVYEVGSEPLEAVVGRLLRSRRLRLATAESCTGGLIADRLTNVAGSSAWFVGGVVAYSNEVKSVLLGVSGATLRRYGAVSAETVREMALGACRLPGADAAVAVSGIAGPTGGTRAKPVGLVYLAVNLCGRAATERRLFNGTRRMVKERAASAALDLCRRVLEARA